jgi:hypothetical protein
LKFNTIIHRQHAPFFWRHCQETSDQDSIFYCFLCNFQFSFAFYGGLGGTTARRSIAGRDFILLLAVVVPVGLLAHGLGELVFPAA